MYTITANRKVSQMREEKQNTAVPMFMNLTFQGFDVS
jgi:ribosomal protein L39E